MTYDYSPGGLVTCGYCGLSDGGKTRQEQLPYRRCTTKYGRQIKLARAELAGQVGTCARLLTRFRQGHRSASAFATQHAQIDRKERAFAARRAAIEAEQGPTDADAAKLAETGAVVEEVRPEMGARVLWDVGGG